MFQCVVSFQVYWRPYGILLMPKPEAFSSSAIAALVTLNTFHPHNSLIVEDTGEIPVLQTCATDRINDITSTNTHSIYPWEG